MSQPSNLVKILMRVNRKTLDFLRRFDYIIAFMFFNCTNVMLQVNP
ncbi:hypothetical protein HMPREF1493_1230 [Atopobium sp. ICM42b]|nr:hypothetical protein HMPREF1492_1214 [Atopobium sp. BS2]EWC96080.1 hypothetical protein HMPREF1493_1230 [Atopobium sp. ICM42b]